MIPLLFFVAQTSYELEQLNFYRLREIENILYISQYLFSILFLRYQHNIVNISCTGQ